MGSGSWVAEDAAQEAMIDVMRGIPRLREPNAVRAWALHIAATRAMKVARRERLLRLLRSSRSVPELAVLPANGRQAELKAAFDTLPPRMRAIAVLRLCAGLSEEETAAAVGCAPGTIKSQFHEARRRLAETLRSEGVRPLTQSAPSTPSGPSTNS